MAGIALAFADEDRQSPLRRERIACGGGAIAAGERVAKVIEGRASRFDRLLERRHRLGNVHRERLVVGWWKSAESPAVAACESGRVPHRGRDAGVVASHLARIEHRSQALRPQAVACAVPAVPAVQPHIRHGRRVAVDR
jgi:hypothetical protein